MAVTHTLDDLSCSSFLFQRIKILDPPTLEVLSNGRRPYTYARVCVMTTWRQWTLQVHASAIRGFPSHLVHISTKPSWWHILSWIIDIRKLRTVLVMWNTRCKQFTEIVGTSGTLLSWEPSNVHLSVFTLICLIMMHYIVQLCLCALTWLTKRRNACSWYRETVDRMQSQTFVFYVQNVVTSACWTALFARL